MLSQGARTCDLLTDNPSMSQPQCGYIVPLTGALSGKAMQKKSLYRQTLVVGLFLLSGCELTQNAQRDFNRLINGNVSTSSSSRSSQQAYAPRHTTRTDTRSDSKADDPKTTAQEAAATTPGPAAAPAVNLVGKSEGQVRAMLGPPTSVEERAPGKTWHYRDGRCSVDVQLYPDVQTRQFGTLAYEVKSNDNSDEGRRDCLARFRSRAQPGSG
jgi:hypothetical protein